jgi:hypothetical protein
MAHSTARRVVCTLKTSSIAALGIALLPLSLEGSDMIVAPPIGPDTPSDSTAAPLEIGTAERVRIVAILRDFGVRHASLFGSVARGEQRPDSDLDLLDEALDHVPAHVDCLVDGQRALLSDRAPRRLIVAASE